MSLFLWRSHGVFVLLFLGDSKNFRRDTFINTMMQFVIPNFTILTVFAGLLDPFLARFIIRQRLGTRRNTRLMDFF